MITTIKASELSVEELARLLGVEFTDDGPPLTKGEQALLHEEKLREEDHNDPKRGNCTHLSG